MAVHTVGYDERDHLFHLAGEEPARRGTTCAHVSPGLLLVLDRLHDTPAQVLTDCGDVLAQNARARASAGDALTHPPRYRNLARRFFLDPAALMAELWVAGGAGNVVKVLDAMTVA